MDVLGLFCGVEIRAKIVSWASFRTPEFTRQPPHELLSRFRIYDPDTRCVSLEYRKRNSLTVLQRRSFRIKKSSQERQMELFLFGTKHYQIPLHELLSVEIRD